MSRYVKLNIFGQEDIIKKNLSIAWLIVICTISVYFWLTSGWFHIEMLATSEHVKNREWLSIFDWYIFDPHPARLRPLSDIIEVMDATLRPKTFWLFGYHPSLSLSGILMAISCPIFFYGTLRSIGLSRNESIIFTAFFISTISFLSCFVPYFRPAKRLVFLELCALFFLVFHYNINKNSNWLFGTICTLLLFSFFSDEAGFTYWLIMPLFITPKKDLERHKIIIYCLLPLLYLILAKIVLPPIYESWGHYGPRSGVIPAALISDLLSNFLSISFYSIIIENLGHSVGSSWGLLSIWAFVPVTVLVAVSTYACKAKNWVVVSFAFSLLITSTFLTMIDMVNHWINPMAQWTFYYHSPVAIFSILWLASLYDRFRPSSNKFKIIILFIIAIISTLNLVNFHRINEIMKILHTYPLVQLKPRVFDEQKLTDKYERLLGSLPQADSMRTLFSNYRNHPMGNEEYARRLERTYASK